MIGPTLLQMKEPPFSSVTVLESPPAATFLTMPTSSRYLAPLLGRERTASDLSTELGVSLGAVGYRLRQMLRLGLVERTRFEARQGRAIAHYRATAMRFFAPLALTPIDSLRDLFRHGLADIYQDVEASIEEGWLTVGRSHNWGTLLYRRGPDGPVNRDFVPLTLTRGASFWEAALAPGAPAVWSQHAALDLPDDLAKELQHELATIVDRYLRRAKSRSNKRSHHLQLALAPAAPAHGDGR